MKHSCHRGHHSKTKRRSRSTIIHVTIRPSKIFSTNHSYYSHSFNHLYNTQSLTKTITPSNSTTEHDQCPSIGNVWTNHTDYRAERHLNRDKKKKLLGRRWFIVTSITLLILMTIVVLFLIILLPKPKTRIKPNIVPTLRWNSTGITVAGVTGQTGNASNKLNQPYSMAIDWSDSLYIADQINNRVQKYSRGASVGETVADQMSGLFNTSSNSLHYPMDVAVKSSGGIYVVDNWNQRVQLWMYGSTSGTTVAGTGTCGNANNQFCDPIGITHDEISNTLYISDFSNHRVMSYASNTSFGTVVAGNNGPGVNSTQLYYPVGIYFDVQSNSLLIANYGGNNVVRWTLGAVNWTLIAGNANGTSSVTLSGLNSPRDVTLDPMGNIYVTDAANYRIQFFPVGQASGITIAGSSTGKSGNTTTLFGGPASVVLDGQLNMYVSDRDNHRVQKFMRY